MYSYLSNLYPKGTREFFFRQLDFFDMKVRKEFVVGTILFFATGVSMSISFQFAKIFLRGFSPFVAFLLLFIGVFIAVHVLTYTIMNLIAANRATFVEGVLPDALQLIAANLRAGMTIEHALIAANRKEFGFLNDLFIIIGKEVSTGTEVSDALLHVTKRLKSQKFAKTMELIVMALKSGGELSRLLSEVAENLVHQKAVEDKIKASVMTYLIFIGAAVGFAAPMLYGLSSAIVKVIVTTFASIDPTAMAGVPNPPLKIEGLSSDMAAFLPKFVKGFTQMNLSVLAVMASIILGLINKGKAKYGISYIPLILSSTLFMYWLVSTGANALFSSLL
jgi:hypothetical protein